MKMRQAAIVFLFVFVLAIPSYADQELKGEVVSINGMQVLRVWGTEYEMGFAQGYLLHQQIKILFEEFIMPYTGSPIIYSIGRFAFERLYTVPEEFEEEAQGVLDGALAAGATLFVDELGRELDTIDLAFAGGTADIDGLMACSSLIAWGQATADDPELAGQVAIVRNLDWVALDEAPMLLPSMTAIIARSPDDKRPTISIAFPGFLGCLSCMNDAGIVTVQHQSNTEVNFNQMDWSSKFVPINLAMRQALEMQDPDGDGENTVYDQSHHLKSLVRSSPYNIAAIGPDAKSKAPYVIEADHLGFATRFEEDSPELPGRTLALTNHMRKLSEPDFCYRYDKIVDNLAQWEGQLTLDRMWQNNGDVVMNDEGIFEGDITAQTMIFIPDQMRLALAYASDGLLAPEKEPVWFGWDEIFGIDDDDDDTGDDDDDTGDDDDDDDDNDEVTGSEDDIGCAFDGEWCGC